MSGSCFPALINELEAIHIRAAKLMHKVQKAVKSQDVLGLVGWQLLSLSYIKRVLTLAHSAYYKLGNTNINNLVEKVDASYSLRKKLKMKVARPRLEVGRNSFQHRPAMAWNYLPDSVAECQQPLVFKQNLMSIQQILSNISFSKESCLVFNKNKDFVYF